MITDTNKPINENERIVCFSNEYTNFCYEAWNFKTGALAVSLKNSIEFLIHRGADK